MGSKIDRKFLINLLGFEDIPVISQLVVYQRKNGLVFSFPNIFTGREIHSLLLDTYDEEDLKVIL